MEIKTIVVLGNINNNIDLASLIGLENYRLTQSQGFLKLGKLTASIYKSGKIQIYGIKKVEDIPIVWRQLLEILQNYVDISLADKLPSLKFMLGMDKLPYTVDLIHVSKSFPNENVEYEPEQFPGLIWRKKEGTILLFTSGSVTFTGFKNKEEMISSFIELKSNLNNLC